MNMETWQLLSILFVLVLLLNNAETQDCSIKVPPCLCSEINSQMNGWLYECYDDLYEPKLYGVQYVTDQSLTFECGKHEPSYQSIFKQVHLGQIQTFVFKSCSLPNSSYSQIIPYRKLFPIENIKIEAKQGNGTFTIELFGNMSHTLKSLILNSNHIKTLTESLFNNCTQLKYLSLSNNELQTLPERIFSNTINLITIEITNNSLDILPENVFENLEKLEKLYLYKNKLKELPEGIFSNLVNLQVLDLADNYLVTLSNNIFKSLSSLIHIRLRANKLVTVPSALFNNSKNLQEVDLSLNRFQLPMPEDLFSGLLKLETLEIRDCNLSIIPEEFFAPCPNLIKLILERNVLHMLANNLFQRNSKLKEVNLNFNAINVLPESLFSKQKYLEKLLLFENNVSVIPSRLFEQTKNLKTLILGKNHIQNASEAIFRFLPNLETLDLSSNELSYFKLSSANEGIKNIDLSHNNLKSVPSLQWTLHLRLEMLNLDHNNISSLSIPVLSPPDKRSPTISFAYNNIKTVDIEDIVNNDNAIELLREIDLNSFNSYRETRVTLTSNPFLCNCKLYKFYNYIKQNNRLPKKYVLFDIVGDLTCAEPPTLKNKKIISLSPDEFTCELKENCSSPCKCYFRAVDNANVMNCSNSGLKTLPNLIPHNTNILFFQENLLSTITEFNQSKWQNLSEIYLEANKIANLDGWKIPTNLKNISLNGNNLKQLPTSFLDFASNATQFQLTLSDNPFDCNCSIVSFKNWLAEHYQIVSDVKKVTCENRIEVNGTMMQPVILTTPDDSFCPINDWPYKLHLVTITVICAVLALLLFVVSVLYYRNKQTVIAYVYIHMQLVFNCFFREEDMDENKVFDAFVAYSSSDRDIALKVLEELEGKEPRFQLCIHERNWIAGNPISWNIFNSVQNSKRTIMVISKEFLESMWFEVEFRTAYFQMLEDKIDRLIIIVKGQLPPKENLDKDLQYLLSTKTYLVWEEKWFWEKLKYALPHKKQQLPRSDILALKDRPDSKKIKSIDNQIAYLSSGGHKTPEKFQEVIQNCTNSTVNVFQTRK